MVAGVKYGRNATGAIRIVSEIPGGGRSLALVVLEEAFGEVVG